MMAVLPVQDPQMKVHHGAVGNCVEKLTDHLGVHLPHPFCREFRLESQVGSAGQIHRAQRQRLVHGQDHVAVAADPRFVPHRFPDGLSQHNARILDGVVAVHLKIAAHRHRQVEKPMAGKTVQHVVKKPDAGMDAGLPGPVQA